VVTNSHFTEQAKKLARANDLELWDRQRLIEELLRCAAAASAATAATAAA
jgi:HJR/Mrr/RecB family endonuclease